jgi:hypothetical protein
MLELLAAVLLPFPPPAWSLPPPFWPPPSQAATLVAMQAEPSMIIRGSLKPQKPGG